jgi:membrane-bound ClpP family serine protease
MWVTTGAMLGVLCLVIFAGFHIGPHAHGVAVAIGALVAAWLVYLMVDRGPGPLLWTLLGADLVVGAGVAALAGKVLQGSASQEESSYGRSPLEGAEGVAISELAPEGIVRIRGEQWSATSVNGTVAPATAVQVLRVCGVRLEVWGEEAEPARARALFTLDEGYSVERESDDRR